MMKFVVLIVLFLVHSSSSKRWSHNWNSDFKEYCDDNLNTPCATKCKIGPNCTKPKSDFHNPLSPNDQQYLLDLHNLIRERVARGDYSSVHFPPAFDMEALNYNQECEFMAQCWIRQCNMWHDVHKMTNGSTFGQNLHEYKTSGSFKKVDESFMERGVLNWFREYKLLGAHPQIVNGWYKVSGTGHFTALIWAKTKNVGCAKVVYKDSVGREIFHLYCNYFPAGNIKGAKIYDAHSNTKCERNSRFPHLCGKIENLVEIDGTEHMGPEIGILVLISLMYIWFV